MKKLSVRGELPKNARKVFMERIHLRRFRPLEPDSDAEESFGWCTIGRPLDLELPVDMVFQGEYVTLGLRWDRYRFPSSLVNARLEEAARAARAKNGGEALGRRMREELKQRVVSELRRKLLPSLRSVDVVWSLERSEVTFFSHSGSLLERLSALFELTFGLELVESSPWVLATELLPGPRHERLLQNLEHEGFRGRG